MRHHQMFVLFGNNLPRFKHKDTSRDNSTFDQSILPLPYLEHVIRF